VDLVFVLGMYGASIGVAAWLLSQRVDAPGSGALTLVVPVLATLCWADFFRLGWAQSPHALQDASSYPMLGTLLVVGCLQGWRLRRDGTIDVVARAAVVGRWAGWGRGGAALRVRPVHGVLAWGARWPCRLVHARSLPGAGRRLGPRAAARWGLHRRRSAAGPASTAA